MATKYIPMIKKRSTNLLVLSTSFIIIFLALSTIVNIVYKAIPFAYAQTNTATLASTTTATVIANDSGIVNNSITNTNNTNSHEGLQIKKDIKYFDSSSGYLVYPLTTAGTNGTAVDTSKKLPAVIMIHENRGLNDNIRSMANTLAKQAGYVVFAVDLFKGQSTQDPNQAMQLVKTTRANPQEAISNLKAAVSYMTSLPFVDASKVASIGWCFGGGQSLQLALHSDQHPLSATILYYGTPLVIDKQELSKIKWPVLGIFGDQDKAIPVEQIQQFKAALDADGITNEVHIYKRLGHAFANPSGPNYAPKETADAWQKTLAFLQKYL
jgi:carboxymethylenebutenolidase